MSKSVTIRYSRPEVANFEFDSSELQLLRVAVESTVSAGLFPGGVVMVSHWEPKREISIVVRFGEQDWLLVDIDSWNGKFEFQLVSLADQ